VFVVTEWDEFRDIDWKRVASVMERPLIIDGRNMFCPEEISRHGFQYISVGRQAVAARRNASTRVSQEAQSIGA